ncbi:MAG: sulfatase [Rikenellaceae bacterium]
MNNVILKRSTLAVLGCTAALPALNAAPGEQKDPNILFILVDDFRFDALGYMGNSIVHTPAIDALAEQGVVFKNAFASTPISSASRASILTGLQERTHRYSFQTGPLEDTLLEQAYPLALREAGYNTALFGKLGVVCSDAESLFDEFEDYDRDDSKNDRRGYYYQKLGGETVHLTRYTGQKGLDYLDKQSGDEPFFLSLCFSAPHAHDGAEEQYFWDKEQDDLFADITIPDPEMSSDSDFEKLPPFLQDSFSRLRWTWRFDTPEKYQQMMKGYYRMCSGVDAEIEKLMAKLEEKGLSDNTVVIFVGDNGYFLGERQLADKWLMYDLSVRIPMIIYDPRAPEHKEVDTQALNIDITATIADYAGAEQKPQWQGESLKPWVEQSSPEWDREAILIEHLWELKQIPPSEGVRTDKWKYFRYVNDMRYEELYDLENDPMEANNLAKVKKYRDVLEQMRTKIIELKNEKQKAGGDAPFEIKVDYDVATEGAKAQSTKPTFSWLVPLRAQSQKGYQVLVSSSKDGLERNLGDMWSSGSIGSSCATAVRYDGEPLTEGVKYYWKVRIWDYLNRTTEYSAMQEFTVSPDDEFEATMGEVTAFEVSKSELNNSMAAQLLWGIKSQTADYGSVTIDPQVEEIDKSSIVLSTIRGDIECEYERLSPLEESYRIVIPANMEVNFSLPSDLSGCVSLNKRVINLNHRVLQLQPGENKIDIQVNTF